MNRKYDIAVIGAGPGGYVAAIRGAQLGKNVLLVEKEKLGGVCINWGCIPTKALLYQSQLFREMKDNPIWDGPVDEITLNLNKIQEHKRKSVDRLVKGIEFLLNKNKVTVMNGEASFKNSQELIISGQNEDKEVRADKVILATGSSPGSLPFLKANNKEVVISQQALEFTEIPSRFLVVGAGAVGLEMGSLFQRLGSRVTILEIMPQILPGSDEKTARSLERELKKQGIEILTEMKIQESHIKNGTVTLKGVSIKKDSPFEYEADKVLMAVGRKPNSQQFRNTLPKLELDKAGFVKVNEFLETSIENIYAIGDLTGGQLLAHKASHEGITAAENAAGVQMKMDHKTVPSAVFTEPEFSSVGLTEEQARDQYGDGIRIGKFPLRANSRAVTVGKLKGFVKIIADQKETIVGAHILSPHASELIPELVCAVQNQIKLRELSSVVHVHPTLSESIIEAAFHAQNRAIHIYEKKK
ncbi:MAG: dihydrolipoyl dehydrogenase [Candidatus Aminicenantes bacterium]|nr:dihydrolipoyl dehydrogenase [Candidatus Aminicenantes bacterium]